MRKRQEGATLAKWKASPGHAGGTTYSIWPGKDSQSHRGRWKMWLEESTFQPLHWSCDPDKQHKMDGQIFFFSSFEFCILPAIHSLRPVEGKVHPKMKILCLSTKVRLNFIIHRTVLELESKTALKMTEVLKNFLIKKNIKWHPHDLKLM